MKCINCTNEALYTYVMTAENYMNYCDSCLPGFLSGKKAAGQLPLLSAPVIEEPVSEPAPKASKKKSAEAPVEESEITDATN